MRVITKNECRRADQKLSPKCHVTLYHIRRMRDLEPALEVAVDLLDGHQRRFVDEEFCKDPELVSEQLAQFFNPT